MAIQQQIINTFQKAGNPDIVLSLNENKVFFVAEEVDGSFLPEYKRDLINSYDPSIIINLKNKLNSFLNSRFNPESISSVQKENYFISKIQGEGIKPEYLNKFRRIYYYVELSGKISLEPKDEDVSIKEEFEFISIKETINTRLFSDLSKKLAPNDKNILNKRSTLAPVPEKFKDWYLYYFQVSENQGFIQNGIDNILKSLNKKGSWIKQSEQITDQSKATYEKVNVNFEKQFVDTLLQLENNIILFFDSLNNFGKPSATEATVIGEILFDKSSLKNGLSIFYNYLPVDADGNPSVVLGIPKYYIDKFPNLSVATDLKEFAINDIATFDNLEDVQKSVKSLRSAIEKKLKSLEDSKFVIENYDINYYLNNIDQFVSNFTDKINEQKIDAKSKFTFQFKRNKCELAPSTQDSEVNNANLASYNLCLEKYVDGQTNLSLVNFKVSDSKEYVPSSLNIDSDISAYLFVNSKNIFNSSANYVPKSFFSKLVYEKTKFKKDEQFPFDTFMTQAQMNFQRAFVNDFKNVVIFSNIRKNIEKNNFSKKTILQNIKDILQDIRSLKQLYENILYRFDLKDIVDEAIECYLQNNPLLNEELLALTSFIENLVKFLNLKDPNVVKAIQCTGFPLPASFGAIVLPSIPDISGEFKFDDSVYKKVLEELVAVFKEVFEKATDIDFVSTTLIKCLDTFYNSNQELNKLIETYIAAKQARQIIKEQYALLVREAKLYKNNPGARDALKKKARNFLSTARRNAWILLQQQAEREAERLLKEAAIQIVKSLLSEVSSCKKDKNSNKNLSTINFPPPIFTSGDNSDINGLLADLFNFFTNEEVCSLFNGSADSDFLEEVLQFIKVRHYKLYSESPIILNSSVVSSIPLSSVFAVKSFFINLSIIDKNLDFDCKNYLDNLENLNTPVDDDSEKCFNFSEYYVANKRTELINKGFTEEQANQIIENTRKQQQEKYKELQNISENGVYNNVSLKEENHTYPVADIVKNKINKQLENMSNSFASFMDSYKFELFANAIQIVNFVNKNYAKTNLGSTDVFYSSPLGTLTIQNKNILFKQKSNGNPTSVEPIFQYVNGSINIPYLVSVKNSEYDALVNNSISNLNLSMKSIISDSVSKDNVQSVLFKLEDNTISYWQSPFDSFALNATIQIKDQYILEINQFTGESYNDEKVLIDVKELIYFDED